MSGASYDDPAKAARHALDVFYDGRAQAPTDPVFIARGLGINVWQSLMDNSLSGMLAKLSPNPDGDIDLLVNSNHAPVRQRFTVAHELGHYYSILRTNPELDLTFMFKRDDVSSCGVSSQEIYANKFAAELLMPSKSIDALWPAMDAVSLAATFQVSLQAMNHRLKNLRLV
ncbi:ImmA/IrrE family metallo-endopeptidase [Clavibacter michiganensis]|uniref:ImmA/IrrE family metallo-endopeptidase n=1 Tax=Clavibacter michiganensis TaxID=28447 RepID=UPI0013651DE9